MKLNENNKSLELKLRNPKPVLDKVKQAKQYNAHGVSVPFTLPNVRRLASLGMSPPSTIQMEYDWPGRFTPFEAQRVTAGFATLYKRAFILNDLGTGKTMSVLWAFDYLRRKRQCRQMLVIAPLSTLDRAWADEIFMHFPHLSFTVLHGTAAKRRKLIAAEYDVYIINHDGVQVIEQELRDKATIDLVVVDEISLAARNAQTDRWKSLNKVVNKAVNSRMAWGMTGTPTPNRPTDAWAQVRLIRPPNVPMVFTKFKHMTMTQVTPFLWIPKKTATDTVNAIMKPAIRYSREEVVDLPPVMYEAREVALSPPQAKAYAQMVTSLRAEVDGGKILAVNEAVKAQKLVQIACGVAYDQQGNELTMNPIKRLNEVHDAICQTPHKVIVFVPFISTIKMVVDFLEGKKHTVAMINGSVPKGKRDEIFSAFQNDSDPRVLVAQPAAMSHGLTLTAANMVVWYAPVVSNDTYTQANGRVTRPGQKNNQLIIHLQGTAIERQIYTRLKNKQALQGVLLDTIKAGRKNA